MRIINLIDENGDISRKLYGSYCLIQFPEESCDSFKLYMADQSFCAWFILSVLKNPGCPKFSVNLQNSPKLQVTDDSSMINIEGQNVTMRIVTDQSIKKLNPWTPLATPACLGWPFGLATALTRTAVYSKVAKVFFDLNNMLRVSFCLYQVNCHLCY